MSCWCILGVGICIGGVFGRGNLVPCGGWCLRFVGIVLDDGNTLGDGEGTISVDGNGITLGDGNGITLGDGDGITLGDGDTFGVGDGITLGDGDGITLGDGDGITLGDGDGTTGSDGGVTILFRAVATLRRAFFVSSPASNVGTTVDGGVVSSVIMSVVAWRR